MRSRQGLLLAAVLIFSGLSSRAQMRNSMPGGARVYSISGKVVDDADQHPLAQVRVDLKLSDGETVGTSFTHLEGEFDFEGLANGDYYVTVAADGYMPFSEGYTIWNGSRPGVYVMLRRPIKFTSAKPGNPMVSARELSIPHKAHDAYEKGLDLANAKSDYHGALKQFQKATKEFPTYYEAFAMTAVTELNLGQPDAAEGDFRKAIELSSGHYAEALYMLSTLLNNTKRYSEAEAFARQAVNLDANGYHGYLELARALEGQKRPFEAERSAIKAGDLSPDSPQVHLILANIHIQTRNYVELLKDLDAFLKLEPNGPASDQARKTRNEVSQALQKAQVHTPQAIPKP